ncbi:hypothetical protein BGX31_009867 [Mortierella sp. GBA43]|nr:hypothetical protein BGX31_009867 [Mortierella sp. GBA43]
MRVLEVLSMEFPDPDELGPDCKLLTKILVSGNVETLSSAWTLRLMNLVKNNPHIRTLTLMVDNLDHLISDHKVLRHLPALKDLTIHPFKVERATTFDEILECGRRLERLDFWFPVVQTTNDVKDSGQGDRSMWDLSSLSVYGKLEPAMTLVDHCPHLTSFKISGDYRPHRYFSRLIEHHHSGFPLRLQDLTLETWDDDSPISSLEEFIKACGESSGLRSIDLDSVPITKNIILGLSNFHAETLEKVILHFCHPEVSGHGMQIILNKCLGLKHLELEGIRVFMEDITQLPWMCKGLQILKLHVQGKWYTDWNFGKIDGGTSKTDDGYYVSPDNDEALRMFDDIVGSRQQFWNQIGEMTSLRILHVHTFPIMACSQWCRHIRVGDQVICNINTITMQEGGVACICKLDRLVELKIDARKPAMTAIDRAAIIEKRPGLRIIQQQAHRCA